MLPACYAASKKWLQSNSNICKIFKVKFVGQVFSNISPSNIIKGWLFGWVLNLLKVPSSTYQEQTSLSLPILNDAKHLRNYWNPGTWVPIQEYSAKAIQWIPTWHGLDGFQNLCDLVLWTKVVSALEGLRCLIDMFEWSIIFLHKIHQKTLAN